LWRKNAQHANRMAKLLQKEVSKIPQAKIVYKVEANGVFAQIPREAIAKLQKSYFFYVWDEDRSMVRWMCSFDTTKDDIIEFARYLSEQLRNG
jgi:threonine aldolase